MSEKMGKLMEELESKCEGGDSVQVNARIKVKEEKAAKNDSLSDTIRRLSAGFPVNTGDFKVKEEVVIGEPSTGTYNGKKVGTCGGLWFNTGNPFTHVREYQRWKMAMRENALVNHAPSDNASYH